MYRYFTDCRPEFTGHGSAKAQVVRNCQVTVTNINFGACDPIIGNKSAALNGSGQIVAQCTKGTTFNQSNCSVSHAPQRDRRGTPDRTRCADDA